MVANIVGMLGSSVSAVLDWFTRITFSSATIPLITTGIMISLVFRFLIRPFVGQASSDAVRTVMGRDPHGFKRDYERRIK